MRAEKQFSPPGNKSRIYHSMQRPSPGLEAGEYLYATRCRVTKSTKKLIIFYCWFRLAVLWVGWLRPFCVTKMSMRTCKRHAKTRCGRCFERMVIFTRNHIRTTTRQFDNVRACECVPLQRGCEQFFSRGWWLSLRISIVYHAYECACVCGPVVFCSESHAWMNRFDGDSISEWATFHIYDMRYVVDRRWEEVDDKQTGKSQRWARLLH